ncbi:ABC transporter permease [Nakamurella sp.]|uniref:ABC transporter permease n=1 Tax=Nakamurella sp. TaxID=1869182 RepID=UPI00378470F9
MMAPPTSRDRQAVLTRVVLAAAGLAAFVAFAATIPYFLTVDNMVNLVNDVALVGIVALPATFLMMSGQVDLSVGAAAGFVGIVLAGTAPDSGLLPAVLLAIATGALIGVVNGLLVTEGEVNSIAATFASMALLRGLAYLVPSGLAIALPGFRSLGTLRPILGIAVPTLIFAAIALVAAVLSRSAVGRRSREVGSMPAAERLDGPGERHWVIALFVVSGLAAALAGLIRTSQLGTGLPTAGIGIELTVVTAVLLGGGHLTGGRGSVGGTLLALLLMSIVDNGLSLANVTPYAGQVFHAALLLLALVVDRPRRRSRTRSAARSGPGPDAVRPNGASDPRVPG